MQRVCHSWGHGFVNMGRDNATLGQTLVRKLRLKFYTRLPISGLSRNPYEVGGLKGRGGWGAQGHRPPFLACHVFHIRSRY